jgi:mannose-1-phosphate guanylyltransferase/mannose-6-phosphate isomerase
MNINLSEPPQGRKPIYIFPVILSGGSGTRLWPLSRTGLPKQFLQLTSHFSLLQETARILSDRERFDLPTVVCHEDHRFIVAEQLRMLDIAPRAIILEPFGRNTAPAVSAAAFSIASSNPDALMLVMPADLAIRDQDAFLEAVDRAAGAAADGAMVCLGARVERAETGYGLIRCGRKHDTGVSYDIESFCEYPNAGEVSRCVHAHDHFWNTGILLLPASLYLRELETLSPGTFFACKAAMAQSRQADYFVYLEPLNFNCAKSESIGTAVMEHARHSIVVPVAMGWSDLGAWDRLWAHSPKDAEGNVAVGTILALDTHDCYLRTDTGLVAAIGLEDIIVVRTKNSVLVAARKHAHRVKDLVARLDQLYED